MKSEIQASLVALNKRFYAAFADEFAATRRSWPPGFKLILPYLRSASNVLDLGCGNGRLLTFLIANGWSGHYLGVDSSEGLLDAARQAGVAGRRDAPDSKVDFVMMDLPDGLAALHRALPGGRLLRHEAVAMLALLHHVPGVSARERLTAMAAGMLQPGGRLVISTWQFLTAPRLHSRILPWERAGLRQEDVEDGDYLLRWGQGAGGMRYCAAISAAELERLAAAAGLHPVAVFRSDGHEGDLNLYGIFTAT